MENPPKPLKFAPKIALAVCIGLLDDNYKKVAYHLNDKGKTKIVMKNVIAFPCPLAVGEIIMTAKVNSSPFFGQLII